MQTRREFVLQSTAAGLLASAASRAAAASPKSSLKTCKIPHTDLTVTRIAHGTAAVGDDRNSPEFAAGMVRAIRAAHDNGINFFDLADVYPAVYGSGQAESVLGEVLRGTPGLRNQLVIQSKCGMVRSGSYFDLSREHIVRAAEGSLKRLGTDRMDILLLHWSDALMEPQEVAQAFDDLHSSGKVRYFGVSNHSIVQIELLKKHLRQPLVANQIRLGLAYSFPLREAEYTGVGGIVDYCQLRDIQVQAWSPLRVGSIFNPPSLLNPPTDAPPELKKAAQALVDLAQKKGTNPSAIALAWLLRHPAGIVPIIGATNPQHIAENCEADRIELTRQEWYGLFNAAAGIQPGKTA